jgi:hypothetical protein
VRPENLASVRHVKVADAELRLEQALELLLAADGTVLTNDPTPKNNDHKDYVNDGDGR